MKYNYLIESSDSLSLKKKINELIEKNNFQDISINNYDLEEVELSVPLEDLDTYGLFSTKKIIIMNNIENLNVDTCKSDYNHLINYLDNPNQDNLLIITAKKLNNTKKLTKELKKKMEFIPISLNGVDYAKQELKGYKLENGVIRKLIDYCKEDITKIHNECKKLKNYRYQEKEIKLADIDQLVIKKQEDITELTFEFVRKLAIKDKKNALKIYKELEENEIEPISLVGLLASQIRIIYQVKVLDKKRLSNEEIASTLKEKSSYRIKKTQELINYYTEDELLALMQKLADIDLKIKTTDVDGRFLIELFILNI